MKLHEQYSIALIGAGNLGNNLAIHLFKNGFNVNTVISRKLKSAAELAGKINAGIASENVKDIPDSCNLIIVAVPDDKIEEIDDLLYSSENQFNGKFVFHTSGLLTSSLLSKVTGSGAKTASMHPMQTFCNTIYTKSTWENVYFGIEGHSDSLNVLKNILNILNQPWVVLEPEQKTAYHLGGIFCSNYLVSLINIVYEIYFKAGINPKEVNKIMYPLIKQTLDNINKSSSLYKGLSGPVKRGDIKTLENHLKWLKEYDSDILLLYKHLGKSLLKLSKEFSPDDYNCINNIGCLFN